MGQPVLGELAYSKLSTLPASHNTLFEGRVQSKTKAMQIRTRYLSLAGSFVTCL